MENNTHFDWKLAVRYGLLAGVVALSVSVIGMVDLFTLRDLIAGLLTLGQVILFLAPVGLSYVIAGKQPEGKKGYALIAGLITSLVASLPLVILVILATSFDLRQFLPNVSPALINTLTFGQGVIPGIFILMIVMGILGLLSAGMSLLPDRYRKPILSGILWTLVIGMFSEILTDRLRSFFGVGISKVVFSGEALRPTTALIIFIIVTLLSAAWYRRGEAIKERIADSPTIQSKPFRWGAFAVVGVIFLLLPFLLGTYLSEVANNVLIFAIMGFGLNIVVGFAGLLDLGYVAFFAIGAYMMALLTSDADQGIAGMSFWLAIPICVAVAILAGLTLGIPVLRMRGDYLAIVTLAFGEIIRILVLSDLLKPYIGGAQGILKIPKPTIVGVGLVRPDQFYYVLLLGCILAAFISWRLSGARLGRQWMAMREDEDVAEAMGINLVSTKLLAFAIGAGFSGLAGAIFASKLTSIFPHSFSLMISINVLCMIIVGGIGSLPGVIIGSLALVGLPELLREFKEFRLLMYGILLIVMMLARPEGLWPSAVRKRELLAYQESGPTANAKAVESEA